MSDTIQAESEPETRKAGVEDNDKEQIKTQDEPGAGLRFGINTQWRCQAKISTAMQTKTHLDTSWNFRIRTLKLEERQILKSVFENLKRLKITRLRDAKHRTKHETK